jgi:streptogramin lyase
VSFVVTLVALVLPACGSGGAASSTSAVPSATPSSVRSGSPPPPSFDDPIDVAFGRAGRVWIGNYASSTLLGYRAADLRAASGQTTVAPAVTLTGVGGPNHMIFDDAGDMWVAAYDDDAIDMYPPSALSASGSPAPEVTIRGSHIESPTDLAFDGRGWLWVANQGTGDVLGYAPDQLHASGRPPPRVVLQPFPGAQQPPEALAFDAQGRLWVSEYDLDLVLAFDPSQLGRSGTPGPSERLHLPQLSGPIGLTFDDMNRLWIAEATADAIAAFAPGRTRPDLTLTGNDLEMPHIIRFGPDGDAWIPCYGDTVLRYDARDVGAAATRPTLILR